MVIKDSDWVTLIGIIQHMEVRIQKLEAAVKQLGIDTHSEMTDTEVQQLIDSLV